jgi:formylglycine-generating enzyme required for sulfatase activity
MHAAPPLLVASLALAAQGCSRCPSDMVFIAPGTFIMGITEAGQKDLFELYDGAERHTVTLTQGYCIDKTEVTARAYRACIAAGRCPENHGNAYDEERLGHPVNSVRWLDAQAYCTWVKKRLPTEAEWEYAAKGPQSYRHPWGNTPPNDELLWYSGNIRRWFSTSPVGTHPKGASPFGVLDMEGNVSEYVADWYAPHPTTRQVDPKGPSTGTYRVVKGGALDSGMVENDLGERHFVPEDREGTYVRGFRCAK